MVDDAQIARILANAEALEQRARRLIEAANANGGRDNISVLLAQSRGVPRKRSFISRLLGNQ